MTKSVHGVDGYPTYPKSNKYFVSNEMGNPNYRPNSFKLIPLSEARAGDLMAFPNPGNVGHSGIMGAGKTFISARQFVITKENLFWPRLEYFFTGRDIAVRRYVP